MSLVGSSNKVDQSKEGLGSLVFWKGRPHHYQITTSEQPQIIPRTPLLRVMHGHLWWAILKAYVSYPYIFMQAFKNRFSKILLSNNFSPNSNLFFFSSLEFLGSKNPFIFNKICCHFLRQAIFIFSLIFKMF